MRIALDTTRLLGPRTGIHRYLSFIADPRLPRRHEWVHLAKPLGMRQLHWQRHGLPDAAARAGADVIFTPHFWDSPGRTPLPVVAVVHDVWPLEHPRRLDPHYWRHRLVHPLRRAQGVICVSGFTRDRLQRSEPRLRGRITVLPTPPAAAFVPEGPHDLPSGCPERFFLAVLSDDPRKNISFLAGLMPLLPEPLVVVGDIPAEKLKGAHMLGTATDETLAALYRGAAALLFPSLYEGYGLPPLEAAACGCPALVAATSALPEVMGEDYPGLLPLVVEEWAALAGRLLTDRPWREACIQAGFRAANRHPAPQALGMAEDFLEEVLAAR